MNRLEWLKVAGVAGFNAAMPEELFASVGTATSVKADIVRLKLRHTWTTTMSASTYRDTLHVRYERDGITGFGDGEAAGLGLLPA